MVVVFSKRMMEESNRSENITQITTAGSNVRISVKSVKTHEKDTRSIATAKKKNSKGSNEIIHWPNNKRFKCVLFRLNMIAFMAKKTNRVRIK